MDQSMKQAKQSFGEDRLLSLEKEQNHLSSSLQERLTLPHTKPVRRLFTKKRALSLGLALLTIVVIPEAGFLLIPRPTQKWSYQPDIPYHSSFSPPIISNGMVYTLFKSLDMENNEILALEAHSGQVRWLHNIDGFISYSPIVTNGIMYVVSANDAAKTVTLYALDTVSGKEKWSSTIGNIFPAPTVANGIVYIYSVNGDFSALDARSGHQIWTRQVGEASSISPMVVNGIIYIVTLSQATQESQVLALNAASGHTMWSTLEATLFISRLTLANGLVYIATENESAQVSALDAFSGKTKWSTNIRERTPVASLSLQVVNGMAYVDYAEINVNGASGGTNALYALDGQTGQQVWTTQTFYADPTIVNGEVYVYSSDGNLSALNALSGQKQWSHKAVPFDNLSLSTVPEPEIINSTIYVRTNALNNDTLYALNAVSGSEKWSYQTRGYFTTSPTVDGDIVYASINENVEAIQPPDGAPGFSL